MPCILHMLTLSMLMMSLLLSAFSSCPAYRPFVSPFLFFRDSCQLSQQATPCCSHIALRLESFSSSVKNPKKKTFFFRMKMRIVCFFFKKYIICCPSFSPAAAGLMSRPKYYSSLVILFPRLVVVVHRVLSSLCRPFHSWTRRKCVRNLSILVFAAADV